MRLRPLRVRRVSNRTQEPPTEKKAEKKEECEEEPVRGSKRVSGPRQQGLCAEHPEDPGLGGVHGRPAFLGLPPSPQLLFFFFKYLPLVESVIFIGLLTEPCEVKFRTPKPLLRKWGSEGELTARSHSAGSGRTGESCCTPCPGTWVCTETPGRGHGLPGPRRPPTSRPLERPFSCKVSRVRLRGVSRACSGLVSGLVGWQKARHLVTRHSDPAEPWVSRLITPCNTAQPLGCSSRGLPPPPAREPGLTRAGGLPPGPAAPPEPRPSTWTLPRGILLPNFTTVGLRDPPTEHFSSPENRPPLVLARNPLLGSGQALPRGLDPVTLTLTHTHTHTHTHTRARTSSHKRADAPEPRCAEGFASGHHQLSLWLLHPRACLHLIPTLR